MAVTEEQIQFKKKKKACYVFLSQAKSLACFMFHLTTRVTTWRCNPSSVGGKTLLTHKGSTMPCPQFPSLSLCVTSDDGVQCDSPQLSCSSLPLLAPAEIKGFLHRAHVHIGMPWHMFESKHNMCDFAFECACVSVCVCAPCSNLGL